MIPLFAAFISQCTAARLRVSVYYTRAPSSGSKSLEAMYLPPGVTLAPGRPKLSKHLEAVVASTLTTNGVGGGVGVGSVGVAGGTGRCGVFVGVCGPLTLGRSVTETVRCYDEEMRRAVGGIEVHEE
jgi:ferric-chelate reductase